MLLQHILTITCTIMGPTFSAPMERSAAKATTEEVNLRDSRAGADDQMMFPDIAPSRASTRKENVHDDLCGDQADQNPQMLTTAAQAAKQEANQGLWRVETVQTRASASQPAVDREELVDDTTSKPIRSGDHPDHQDLIDSQSSGTVLKEAKCPKYATASEIAIVERTMQRVRLRGFIALYFTALMSAAAVVLNIPFELDHPALARTEGISNQACK
ncbi:hypothetical protein PtA15_13A151 [Puccinia triticina]|uniref:Uncharacterized protein n=1 Tax=Puccinia triticina TaxID=208348 RepID=A0ABY7D3A8_9BASI|nr:uncharacterized protein PtA15_13A151 [Puccinia triticina]WAQ90752.1 hypothetical protein PtA15_13A151 [Puccinia triticina]